MKFWKSKTFAVGVIIVCSALLIGLSWMNRQQERRRLAQLRALQQQAAPYEQEIREIQSELDKREKAISTNTDISGVIPCFRISSAKDIEVVKELQSQGIDVWMLTGDNRRTAQYIAKQAGITHVIAEVLPQDKASKVKELQDKGLVVGMVGDGINDAPALVTADIGFAIGSGTDIAVEAADIVLVRNDLHTLVQAVRLSRKTMTNIKQNLFWALIFNCIGIPLAAIGALNPMIAGTAMAFSSVTVVGNSLRLKRAKI